MWKQTLVLGVVATGVAFGNSGQTAGIRYVSEALYEGRLIRVEAGLELPEVLRGQATVRAYEEDRDVDTSVDPIYHCDSSIEFGDGVMSLKIENLGTTEILFDAEVPAALVAHRSRSFETPTPCVVADFSSGTELQVRAALPSHVQLGQVGGDEVSLALYNLVGVSGKPSIRLSPAGYEVAGADMIASFPTRFEMPVIQWSALSRVLDTFLVTVE